MPAVPHAIRGRISLRIGVPSARGTRYRIIGTPWTENSNGQPQYLELIRRHGGWVRDR